MWRADCDVVPVEGDLALISKMVEEEHPSFPKAADCHRRELIRSVAECRQLHQQTNPAAGHSRMIRCGRFARHNSVVVAEAFHRAYPGPVQKTFGAGGDEVAPAHTIPVDDGLVQVLAGTYFSRVFQMKLSTMLRIKGLSLYWQTGDQ